MVAFSRLRSRSKFAPPAALVASVVFHGMLIAVGARWLSSVSRNEPAFVRTMEVTLADEAPRGKAPLVVVATPGTADLPRAVEEQQQESSGPLHEPRPDTRTSGHGGSRAPYRGTSPAMSITI